MYCDHCGSQIPNNTRFCPQCGAPVSGAPAIEDATTTRLPRNDTSRAAHFDATSVRPSARPAERAHDRGGSYAPQTSGNRTASEPEPQSRRVGGYLILALVCVIGIAVLGLALCSGSNGGSFGSGGQSTASLPAESNKPSSPAEPTDVAEDDASNPSTTPDEQQTNTQPTVSTPAPENPHAGGPEQLTSSDTLASWEEKACAFMTIYPASYLKAGGTNDDPVAMSVEDWASNCLRYVDPSSSLGQALQNDPESIATPLGFHDAATYVSSTEVMSSDSEGVVVQVVLEGTQQDWEHALSIAYAYLVQFNADGLVVGVVDYS